MASQQLHAREVVASNLLVGGHAPCPISCRPQREACSRSAIVKLCKQALVIAAGNVQLVVLQYGACWSTTSAQDARQPLDRFITAICTTTGQEPGPAAVVARGQVDWKPCRTALRSRSLLKHSQTPMTFFEATAATFGGHSAARGPPCPAAAAAPPQCHRPGASHVSCGCSSCWCSR